MKLLHSKSFQDTIVLVSACPTMNLLAVVMASQLLIYRSIVMTLIWTFPLQKGKDLESSAASSPPSPNGAAYQACWAPSGRQFVLSLPNGDVLLYDVEAGRMVRRLHPIGKREKTNGPLEESKNGLSSSLPFGEEDDEDEDEDETSKSGRTKPPESVGPMGQVDPTPDLPRHLRHRLYPVAIPIPLSTTPHTPVLALHWAHHPLPPGPSSSVCAAVCGAFMDTSLTSTTSSSTPDANAWPSSAAGGGGGAGQASWVQERVLPLPSVVPLGVWLGELCATTLSHPPEEQVEAISPYGAAAAAALPSMTVSMLLILDRQGVLSVVLGGVSEVFSCHWTIPSPPPSSLFPLFSGLPTTAGGGSGGGPSSIRGGGLLTPAKEQPPSPSLLPYGSCVRQSAVVPTAPVSSFPLRTTTTEAKKDQPSSSPLCGMARPSGKNLFVDTTAFLAALRQCGKDHLPSGPTPSLPWRSTLSEAHHSIFLVVQSPPPLLPPTTAPCAATLPTCAMAQPEWILELPLQDSLTRALSPSVILRCVMGEYHRIAEACYTTLLQRYHTAYGALLDVFGLPESAGLLKAFLRGDMSSSSPPAASPWSAAASPFPGEWHHPHHRSAGVGSGGLHGATEDATYGKAAHPKKEHTTSSSKRRTVTSAEKRAALVDYLDRLFAFGGVGPTADEMGSPCASPPTMAQAAPPHPTHPTAARPLEHDSGKRDLHTTTASGGVGRAGENGGMESVAKAEAQLRRATHELLQWVPLLCYRCYDMALAVANLYEARQQKAFFSPPSRPPFHANRPTVSQEKKKKDEKEEALEHSSPPTSSLVLLFGALRRQAEILVRRVHHEFSEFTEVLQWLVFVATAEGPQMVRDGANAAAPLHHPPPPPLHPHHHPAPYVPPPPLPRHAGQRMVPMNRRQRYMEGGAIRRRGGFPLPTPSATSASPTTRRRKRGTSWRRVACRMLTESCAFLPPPPPLRAFGGEWESRGTSSSDTSFCSRGPSPTRPKKEMRSHPHHAASSDSSCIDGLVEEEEEEVVEEEEEMDGGEEGLSGMTSSSSSSTTSSDASDGSRTPCEVEAEEEEETVEEEDEEESRWQSVQQAPPPSRRPSRIRPPPPLPPLPPSSPSVRRWYAQPLPAHREPTVLQWLCRAEKAGQLLAGAFWWNDRSTPSDGTSSPDGEGGPSKDEKKEKKKEEEEEGGSGCRVHRCGPQAIARRGAVPSRFTFPFFMRHLPACLSSFSSASSSKEEAEEVGDGAAVPLAWGCSWEVDFHRLLTTDPHAMASPFDLLPLFYAVRPYADGAAGGGGGGGGVATAPFLRSPTTTPFFFGGPPHGERLAQREAMEHAFDTSKEPFSNVNKKKKEAAARGEKENDTPSAQHTTASSSSSWTVSPFTDAVLRDPAMQWLLDPFSWMLHPSPSSWSSVSAMGSLLPSLPSRSLAEEVAYSLAHTSHPPDEDDGWKKGISNGRGIWNGDGPPVEEEEEEVETNRQRNPKKSAPPPRGRAAARVFSARFPLAAETVASPIPSTGSIRPPPPSSSSPDTLWDLLWAPEDVKEWWEEEMETEEAEEKEEEEDMAHRPRRRPPTPSMLCRGLAIAASSPPSPSSTLSLQLRLLLSSSSPSSVGCCPLQTHLSSTATIDSAVLSKACGTAWTAGSTSHTPSDPTLLPSYTSSTLLGFHHLLHQQLLLAFLTPPPPPSSTGVMSSSVSRDASSRPDGPPTTNTLFTLAVVDAQGHLRRAELPELEEEDEGIEAKKKKKNNNNNEEEEEEEEAVQVLTLSSPLRSYDRSQSYGGGSGGDLRRGGEQDVVADDGRHAEQMEEEMHGYNDGYRPSDGGRGNSGNTSMEEPTVPAVLQMLVNPTFSLQPLLTSVSKVKEFAAFASGNRLLVIDLYE